MPYASNRDRAPGPLELENLAWPAAPLNLFLMSGYNPGVFDLSWDDPAPLGNNLKFETLGVNIYRSFDSEFGPFDRITELPVGSTFWRDQTDNVLVLEERVQDHQWVLRGLQGANEARPRYVFRTERAPIVREGSQGIHANSPFDVAVRVDGEPVPVWNVHGHTGEIELDVTRYPDVAKQKLDPAIGPSDNSVVTVTYRYNRSLVRTDLGQRVFYRVTTVGRLPDKPWQLLETPLEHAVATNNFEIEKLDYIWREAVRRNRWILQQGGERVKVFIRKQAGLPCGCIQNQQYGQPLNDCLVCFGVGIVGGYEGPYDIVLAPDDAERRIAQRAEGRTMEHSYEVWTGPAPILSQRDFIVKINGERYSVGAVRMPTNRGMMLQQHFMIGHLDEGDIRYKVPMSRPRGLEVGQQVPPHLLPAATTDKPGIPDEREIRGRTAVWEGIVY